MDDDLIEFLCARLDEDAVKIHAMKREQTRVRTAPIFQGHPLGWLDGVDVFVSPDRWQAEVNVKRRVMDEVVDEATGLDAQVDGEFRVGSRDLVAEPYLGTVLLRLLALPYAGHPDYRPEWRL